MVERGRSPFSSSSYESINSIMRAAYSFLRLTLVTSQRTHLQTPSHCGSGLYIWILGRHKHSACSPPLQLPTSNDGWVQRVSWPGPPNEGSTCWGGRLSSRARSLLWLHHRHSSTPPASFDPPQVLILRSLLKKLAIHGVFPRGPKRCRLSVMAVR